MMMVMPKRINKKHANDLFPGENADIREEVKTVIRNYAQWLNTPNTLFAGRKPKDLIGTEDEYQLRNAIRAIKHGVFS
jgi:hypothetical protein